MSSALRKFLLRIADGVFALGAVVSMLISRLDPNRPSFWLGLILAIMAILGAFQLRRISKARRQEVILEITPDDWTLERDNGGLKDAWLTITEDRHERGSDVNVRVEQIALKHWELAEPDLENGKITIRYEHNNFPHDPRIPLRVYISGRG